MLIEISNLSKGYKNKQVIKNMNLNINEGEVIAIVGPNGSGKTTLLNLIAGNIKMDEGNIDISIEGHRLEDNLELRRYIGFLQDSTVLTNDLTGYDHMKFLGDIHNKNKEDIKRVISVFRLDKFIKKKVKNYSLGMKQRLLIALATVHNPKVLILDEPFNGIDYESSYGLKELFNNYKKDGNTIIFTSHILSDIDRITDVIIFLKDGVIQRKINSRKTPENVEILTITEKVYIELFGDTL
ncbi:ABC transporter ATP-binding protein [Sporosarcina sp. PTS2304]|uniref:ABC transporter ATP-binding protein n=1 Tax=Sporosarcina sp. PTS2304 TaxID=2283194 RepID=UPI000E0D41DA|nr:ABC transporter ATP-binding protein [Sporosarcina sp. PTS2304]AXI01097.1 ABC transporter ATP-binding protein [Sporosarcina sp. PTS2304]